MRRHLRQVPRQQSLIQQRTLGNQDIRRRWEMVAWVVLALITTLIWLLVLVPYLGTGGQTPFGPSGYWSSEPDEIYAIVVYRGTLWEDEFWRDVYWNVACGGWCLWVPAFILLLVPLGRCWPILSERERRVRQIVLLCLAIFVVVWFLASIGVLKGYFDALAS